jgi:hypothetical protein
MLTTVEDKKRTRLCQTRDQGVGDGPERVLGDVQLAGDCAGQQVLLGYPRHLDEPDTVIEGGGELLGHLQGEGGLPDASRPGECH